MKRFISLAMWMALLVTGLVLSGCGTDKDDAAAKTEQSSTEAAPADRAEPKIAELVDAHPGKLLHDANCISCHDSKVYTREDHKMQDLTQLAAQVRRCDANLGTSLFDEELDQITEYLNKDFYKFTQ